MSGFHIVHVTCVSHVVPMAKQYPVQATVTRYRGETLVDVPPRSAQRGDSKKCEQYLRRASPVRHVLQEEGVGASKPLSGLEEAYSHH